MSEHETLRRKSAVPPSDRTEERDAAADWIEQNVIEQGRWPMTYTEIAEETGWSRQHISNTISDYFTTETSEAETDPEAPQEKGDGRDNEIFRVYRTGVQDGIELALSIMRQRNVSDSHRDMERDTRHIDRRLEQLFEN